MQQIQKNFNIIFKSMKDFKTKLLGLIDNSASQAKTFIENFNDVVDSFNWENQINFWNDQADYWNEKRKELVKRGNELFGDFAELLKQVKESLTDFSVTVPFDESNGEKISYEIVDGRLVIEVSYEDETCTRSSKTSVIIPSNCDLDGISLETNTASKTATVTIPKMVKEPVKEEVESTKKPKKTVRKKAAKKVEDNSEASNESMTHISSKLNQALKRNSGKYSRILNRGANGRFVRRTPNDE